MLALAGTAFDDPVLSDLTGHILARRSQGTLLQSISAHTNPSFTLAPPSTAHPSPPVASLAIFDFDSLSLRIGASSRRLAESPNLIHWLSSSQVPSGFSRCLRPT